MVAPVPWFPIRHPRFGTWGRYAAVPQQETRHGIEVHHPRYVVLPKIGMSAAPFTLFLAARRAIARMQAQGLAFDLIDAHYFYPDGVVAIWLGRQFEVPVVVTARGSDVTQLPDYAVPRRLILRAMRDADAMITVSAGLRDALLALGAPPGKVTVLRNGVDLHAFRPMDRERSRARLGLDGPTLLSVGHLVERKGHNRVVAAMAHLPGWRLLIVGDGPERGRLAALAAELGVVDRVTLLGSLPHGELPEIYTAADVLVLASSREGWANVLLEAMACGTPVVASPIPGNPEVVQSRSAGVIMPANTAEGVARGVQDLVAACPSRAETRAYAEGFGWEATSAGQLALFRKVLDQAGR